MLSGPALLVVTECTAYGYVVHDMAGRPGVPLASGLCAIPSYECQMQGMAMLCS